MTILEALTLISSAIVLPVIAVVVYAFFSGGLTRTEAAKYMAIREQDKEYWATGPTSAVEGGAHR